MIVWRACVCTIWPIVLGNAIGRCGKCGERPDTPVDEPTSGHAEPLAPNSE